MGHVTYAANSQSLIFLLLVSPVQAEVEVFRFFFFT